jgi:hypothetical protein
MAGIASDLSRQLARNAEAVCRHYLAAGHREGRYWIAGDIQGSKGRSLYVRLKGGEHGKGAPGKWTDAATGEHGDLLDLIGLHFGHCLLSSHSRARFRTSIPTSPPPRVDRAGLRNACSPLHARSLARSASAIFAHEGSPASEANAGSASIHAAGTDRPPRIIPARRMPFPR